MFREYFCWSYRHAASLLTVQVGVVDCNWGSHACTAIAYPPRHLPSLLYNTKVFPKYISIDTQMFSVSFPHPDLDFAYIFLNFLLDILFIYISNVIPIPGFSSTETLSHPPFPCFYEGAPHPNHLLPTASSLTFSYPLGGRGEVGCGEGDGIGFLWRRNQEWG